MGRDVTPDGYVELGFDRLASFEYETPDEIAQAKGASGPPKNQIPAEIRALNLVRVALKGFMLPLTTEGSVVTEFLIMRDQSTCCFGVVPRMNYWVDVHMPKGVKAIMDRVVTVYGKLKVGEERENGYLFAIYQMDGERLVGPAE
jgi:hypothetical protein